MQIPTLTQARRALLELMYAQGDTIPPQFAVISMYLDSQVPLNVENCLTQQWVGRINRDVGNQPGVNDVVSMGCNGGAHFGGGSSAGGMGGGSSAGAIGFGAGGKHA